MCLLKDIRLITDFSILSKSRALGGDAPSFNLCSNSLVSALRRWERRVPLTIVYIHSVILHLTYDWNHYISSSSGVKRQVGTASESPT